jgi:hypothetical protein
MVEDADYAEFLERGMQTADSAAGGRNQAEMPLYMGVEQGR